MFFLRHHYKLYINKALFCAYIFVHEIVYRFKINHLEKLSGFGRHKMKELITPEAENTLLERIDSLNLKGENIPKSVEDIDNFPYENFNDLIEAAKNKNALFLRFSFDYVPSILQTISPKYGIKLTLLATLQYIIPIISIILAFLYSAWCVIGILYFFYGMSLVKKHYNNTVFQASMSNELAFCLLFYMRQISISNNDRSIQYFYNSDNQCTETV